MPDSENATGDRATVTLAGLRNRKPVAFLIVVAAVVGGIATFGKSANEMFALGKSAVKNDVDFLGKWDEDKAWAVVDKRIQSAAAANPGLFCDTPSSCGVVSHAHVGTYDLVYKSGESVMLVDGASEEGNDCHECGVSLSLFEFEKRPLGWKLKEPEIAALSAGAWGKLEDSANQGESTHIGVGVIGDNIYGVFVTTGFEGQGIETKETAILAKLHGEFESVFEETVSEDSTDADNPGDPDKPNAPIKHPVPATTKWTSTLRVQPGTIGFFDILQERQGVDDSKPMKDSKLFKFDGATYN